MTLVDLIDDFRDDVRDSDITWWDNYEGCTIFIDRINDSDYYTAKEFVEDLRSLGHKVDVSQHVDDYDELDALEIDVYPRK